MNRHRLLRADDLVDLQVELFDITPTPAPGGGHELKPAVTGYLQVNLPPQHVGESSTTTDQELKTGQLPVFGFDTRLVFEVPPGGPEGKAIPFTVGGILAALPKLRLVVNSLAGAAGPLPAPAAPVTAAAAARAAGPDILAERARRAAARLPASVQAPLSGAEAAAASAKPPPPLPEAEQQARAAEDAQAGGGVFSRETELHFPSRLVTSPRGGNMRFSHAAAPVVRDGRVQLWHTRLTQLRQDGHAVPVPADLFVLESKDLRSNGPAAWRTRVGDDRINRVLTQSRRKQIVELSEQQPLEADQVLLSPLGAWLDAERYWDRDGFSVQGYRHKMAMGRDLLVRIVEHGRLFPWGHEAILTSTTTRIFPQVDGTVATLLTTDVITVLQPTRTFSANDALERGLPWSSVTLLTRSTPNDADIKAHQFADDAWMLRHKART